MTPLLFNVVMVLLDAEYAINEGGRTRVIQGGRIYLAVQTAEKISHVVTVTAHGRAGHAAIPLPDNAIFRLATALDKLQRIADLEGPRYRRQLYSAITSNAIVANTMSTVMEMIGLSPMHTAAVPQVDSRKDQVAFRCGQIVVDAVKADRNVPINVFIMYHSISRQ